MRIGTPVSNITAAKFSLTGFMLFASTVALAAPPADKLVLGYLANFANGSLEASLDRVGIGPMKTGDSQVPGSNPSWTAQQGEMVLEITLPDGVPGPVDAGVFATPVNFGPGTLFEEHATFIAPAGPHQAGKQWVVGVTARTGGNNDPAGTTRAAATLQVLETSLRLNGSGATVPSRLDLPQDVYDEIFSPTDPQPFTIELLVDRVNGVGRASLKIDDRTFSKDFQFLIFKVDSGPAITAVGPLIAIASASGTQTASVHVREFRMFLPPNSLTNANATCPENWGPNCRSVPKTH